MVGALPLTGCRHISKQGLARKISTYIYWCYACFQVEWKPACLFCAACKNHVGFYATKRHSEFADELSENKKQRKNRVGSVSSDKPTLYYPCNELEASEKKRTGPKNVVFNCPVKDILPG
jgi:hypothetical protein